MPRITGSPTQISTYVATPIVLARLSCTAFQQGDEAWVDSLGKAFLLDRTSKAAPSTIAPINVIPTADGQGNWVVSPEYSNRLLEISVANGFNLPGGITVSTNNPSFYSISLFVTGVPALVGDIIVAQFKTQLANATANALRINTWYTDQSGSGLLLPAPNTYPATQFEPATISYPASATSTFPSFEVSFVVTANMILPNIGGSLNAVGVSLNAQAIGAPGTSGVVVLFGASFAHYRP